MTQKNIFITGKNCTSLEEAKQLLPPNIRDHVFVQMEQVHSNIITPVIKQDTSQDIILTLPKTDGCYTTLDNIVLSIKTADCLPILVRYKPLNLIAAVHAGRKGTQALISIKLLKGLEDNLDLIQNLNNLEEKITFHFAPAICEACYQIDRETDTHYNLATENKKQILDFFEHRGVSQNNISFEISEECTLHDNEKYYSYRNNGPGVKMNYSFIWNA